MGKRVGETKIRGENVCREHTDEEKVGGRRVSWKIFVRKKIGGEKLVGKKDRSE